jgi:hypothetical protein
MTSLNGTTYLKIRQLLLCGWQHQRWLCPLLPGMIAPPELASLVAGAINLRVVSDHWLELLRLALSIKTGTVTASVILRKLAAYPRQNGLALALRELGKLERTFFTLQWLQDPELRRRSHVGLNNLLDVAVAQGKTKVQPYALLHHFDGKSVPTISALRTAHLASVSHP